MPNQPQIKPYHYHVFLCTDSNCDPDGTVRALHRRLVQRVGNPASQEEERCRSICNLSPCLWACTGGPLLVVYPDAVWYHHVDEALLDRIIDEHLLNGQPIEEYAVRRSAEQSKQAIV